MEKRSKCRKRKMGLSMEATQTTFPLAGPSASICSRSSPKRVINLLKANLDDANLDIFRSSCFGGYLDFPTLIFQGPLTYFLLRHLNTESREEGALRFNINGVDACFGPKEFIAITRLSFGPFQKIVELSNWRKLAFGATRKIYTRDIEKKFKQVCGQSKGGGQLALKLAFSLMIHGVFLGPGFNDHSINSMYLDICDDIDALNSFPWGRLSYEYLVAELFESHGRLCTLVSNEKRVSVDINGFALALQVWAYEVFPDIDKLRSYAVPPHSPSAPRIFRWLCPHKLRYATFEDLFVGVVRIKKVAFAFTAEESNEISKYMPHNPVKRKLYFSLKDEDPKLLNEGDCELNRENEVNLFDLNIVPSSSTELSLCGHTSSLEVGSHALQRRSCPENITPMSESGYHIDRLMSSSEVLSSCTKKPGHLPSSSSHANMNDNGYFGSNMIEDDWEIKSEMHFGDLFLEESCKISPGIPFEWDNSWMDEMYAVLDDVKELSPPQPSYSTRTAPSSCTSSLLSWDRGDLAEYHRRFSKTPKSDSNVDNASAAALEGDTSPPGDDDIVKSPVNIMYSPQKRYPRNLLNRFLDWYHEAKEMKNSRTFSIPLRLLSSVTLDWIRPIYMPGRKLNDEHCDVLLNLLIVKATRAPKMFNSMWTCVESLFWNKAVNSTLDDASKLMMKYVMGELPIEGGLPWCNAIEIFGIAHVFNNHWVAYEVNLLEENIIVYESMRQCNDWELLKSHFTPLQKIIPFLLKKAKEVAPSMFRAVSLDMWPVRPSIELPRPQTGINDCGVLAIKYVESLACGYPVGNIDPDKCSDFRRYYCAQLYNAGLADDVCP